MSQIFVPNEEAQNRTKCKRFGRWVVAQLSEIKKTQQDLADVLGISRKCLNRHINEGKPFDYCQMIKIFRYFGASTEEIVRWME